jgi:hypothetical protein
MTTIQPKPNLQAFTDAARQLGEGAIRLKNDGSGIATSTWDRFVVRVVDLFSSAATVQTKELQARTAFLDAIKTAHGPKFLNDFMDGPGALRLDARVVSSYADSATQRGGERWIENELFIRTATTHDRMGSLMRSAADRLLDQAQLQGAERDALRERMMSGPGSPAGIGGLAYDIEAELRSAAQELGPDGRVRNNTLTPATVAATADSVIAKALCKAANLPKFDETVYVQGLIARARTEGLDDFANVLELIDEQGSGNRPSMALGGSARKAFLEIGIRFPVGDLTHILQGREVDDMMAAGLNAAIDRQRTKMNQIATLLPGVPLDNPARRLLEQHFSEGRSKISDKFQIAVQAALDIPSPQDNEASLRGYATALADAMTQAGVSDVGDRADFLYTLVCLDHARGRNGISATVNNAGLMNLVDRLNGEALAVDDIGPAEELIITVQSALQKMGDITLEINAAAAQRG